MAIREFITQKSRHKYLFVLLVVLSLVGLANAFRPQHALASNMTYVTVHYDGATQTLATDAKTIGEFLKRADIAVNAHDAVEPSKDTALLASDYSVNVYRARPVTIIDQGNRYPVITAAQSPKQMAEAAGLKIYPEDKLQTSRIDDFMSEGTVGMKVTIDRAVPVNFVLYGNATVAHTQGRTVGDLLKEKGIVLKEGDSITPDVSAAITPDMTISIVHSGTQVVTVEEDVAFPVETIRDADRAVGFREVKEAGTKGRKLVTYEVTVENGQEVNRKELNSIVKTEPEKQIELIGTKPTFSGDFAAALAKLRSCEGGYGSVNNRAASSANWYYGAYQFNQGTWNSYAPAEYKGKLPTSAPPEVQDQAAANLYQKRGWQPWPRCGKGLPDTYR